MDTLHGQLFTSPRWACKAHGPAMLVVFMPTPFMWGSLLERWHFFSTAVLRDTLGLLDAHCEGLCHLRCTAAQLDLDHGHTKHSWASILVYRR